MTIPTRWRARVAVLVVATLALTSCLAGHGPLTSLQRPSEISREWVDVEKSTPDDTTLWVLRGDGYDGVAHLLRTTDSTGKTTQSRKQTHYGAWYLDGKLGDSTQALCFSRRIGRFGASCNVFVLDTVMVGSVATPRLLLHAYRGSHHTRDRLLLAHMD